MKKGLSKKSTRLAAGRFHSIQNAKNQATDKQDNYISYVSNKTKGALTKKAIRQYKRQADLGEYSYRKKRVLHGRERLKDNDGTFGVVDKADISNPGINFESSLSLSDISIAISPPLESEQILSETIFYSASKTVLEPYSEGEIEKEETIFHPLMVFIREDSKASNVKQTNRIIYYGHRRYFDFFATLVNQSILSLSFDIYLSKTANTCLLDIDCERAEDSEINALVSEILSTVIVEGMPVKHFNAQLFFPFSSDKLKSLSNGESPPQPANDDTKGYFSKLVADKLFPNESRSDYSIQTKSLADNSFKLLTLEDPSVPSQSKIELSAQVNGISLHWSKDFGTGVLEISLHSAKLSPPSEPKKYDDNQWWHYLIDRIESNQHSIANNHQLASLAKLIYYARIVYSSFKDQSKERKITNIYLKDGTETSLNAGFDDGNFNNLIPQLLKLLGVEDSEIVKQPANDRMSVNAAYSLAGNSTNNPIAKNNRENAFKVLLDIDRFIDTSSDTQTCYSPDFTHPNLEIYRRWQHYGTLYGFTDHSNVYLGELGERISTLDVPNIYGKMLTLQLLYKETLDSLERNFSENGKLKKTREQMLKFTRNFWFHNVTEQQQGKEIYHLQGKALGVRTSYEILDKELEQADQNQALINEEKFQRIGLIFATGSLIIGAETVRKPIITHIIEPLTNSIPILTNPNLMANVLYLLVVVTLSILILQSVQKTIRTAGAIFCIFGATLISIIMLHFDYGPQNIWISAPILVSIYLFNKVLKGN